MLSMPPDSTARLTVSHSMQDSHARLKTAARLANASRLFSSSHPSPAASPPFRRHALAITSLVEVLRDARARIDAAIESPEVQPAEAAVARRVSREIERAVARLAGGEAEKDLISVICHDLKDPLASIVMGAGFLRKTAAVEDPTAARVVGAIARSADRMSQLVGDFHDLSRLEEGRLQVERRPYDVVATVRGAIAPLDSVAKERSLAVELDAPFDSAPPLLALGDAGRLAQAVSKLLSNALRFTPAGGRVAVHVERDGDAIRVTVEDTGRGISAERLATIFDHGANARRTPRDGPGLGLAIVRGLVELQGGVVTVRSRESEGSSFTLTLPAAPSSPSAARAPGTPAKDAL